MVSVTTEFLSEGAGGIVRDMTLARETGRGTINALQRAAAVEVCVEVGSGTPPSMIFGGMTAAADRADDDVVGKVTFLHRVPKLVAAITLPNEGKRIKQLGFARSAKHEDRVFSNTRKA